MLRSATPVVLSRLASRAGRLRRRRDERGAMAFISVILALILFATAALCVDVGNAWARRGSLQDQADKAAIFAANYLPAVDANSRQKVARAVAHYIICHPVPRQSEIDQDDIPDESPAICASTLPITSGAIPALNAYAAKLIDNNPGAYGASVSFPRFSSVEVTVPAARIDFNFAPAIPVIGDDDTPGSGSIQRKSATARVTSPGDLLPVGLSLQCLTQSVNNAGLGANTTSVLPLNYITSGQAPNSPTFTADTDNFTNADWPASYVGTNQSANVFIDGTPTVNQSTGVLSTTIRVNNTSTPALSRALNTSFEIVFAQKKNGATSTTIVTMPAQLGISLLNNTGLNVNVTLPAGVTGSTGAWHFKIRLNTGQLLTPNPRWSAGYGNFTIDPTNTSILGQVGSLLSGVADLDQTIACARLMDSPRPRDGGTPTLTINIQEGGDHQLTSNPNLATVVSNLNLQPGNNDSAAELLNTVQGLLGNPAAGLTGCAETSVNHRDTTTNWQNDVIANCGLTRNDAQVEQEFTDGFLKETDAATALTPGYGRLRCSRPGACDTPGADAPVALPGFSGTYNNDSFRNFVPTTTNVLNSQFAYGLDTYLLPGTPLITPSNNISTTIYGSPRFFWSPVLTYINLQGPGAFYPILTFRPMFIDNGVSNNLPIAGINVSQVVNDVPGFVLGQVTSVCNRVGALPLLCATATATLTTAITALGPTPSVNSILTVLNSTLGLIDPNFNAGQEVAGLLIRNKKLKGARFMTISPDALPPVPADYSGPETDYLGVGPKLIRLVK